jgi:hypothetical protein
MDLGLGGPLLFAVLAVVSLLSAYGIARDQSGSQAVRVLLVLAVVCAVLAGLLWAAVLVGWP